MLASGSGTNLQALLDDRVVGPCVALVVSDVPGALALERARGRRIRAVVLEVGRTPVPPTHRVVRLVLADGRRVLVSPGHPTPGARKQATACPT